MFRHTQVGTQLPVSLLATQIYLNNAGFPRASTNQQILKAFPLKTNVKIRLIKNTGQS